MTPRLNNLMPQKAGYRWCESNTNLDESAYM